MITREKQLDILKEAGVDENDIELVMIANLMDEIELLLNAFDLLQEKYGKFPMRSIEKMTGMSQKKAKKEVLGFKQALEELAKKIFNENVLRYYYIEVASRLVQLHAINHAVEYIYASKKMSEKKDDKFAVEMCHKVLAEASYVIGDWEEVIHNYKKALAFGESEYWNAQYRTGIEKAKDHMKSKSHCFGKLSKLISDNNTKVLQEMSNEEEEIRKTAYRYNVKRNTAKEVSKFNIASAKTIQ